MNTLPRPFPIERFTRVAELRQEPHQQIRVTSRPGHLLHLMEEGAYDVCCDGRHYHLQQGDVLYYHNAEDVIWLQNLVPVRFIAIGFYAPSLQPPPVEQRHMRSKQRLRKVFRDLLGLHHTAPTLERDLQMYAELCRLLALLSCEPVVAGEVSTQDKIWWEVEYSLRKDRDYRPLLAELAARHHTSISTLTRACRRATGLTPMQRIRRLRQEEARGMLLYSGMRIGEIAAQLGYPRMHEFCREFRGAYGCSPSALRRREQCR